MGSRVCCAGETFNLDCNGWYTYYVKSCHSESLLCSMHMYIIRGNNLYTKAKCEPTLSEDSNLVNLLDTVQGIQQIDSGK